jgi:peroxiredoxin
VRGEAPTAEETAMTDPNRLPADLPVPEDDGAADHLPGLAMPRIELPSTAGDAVTLPLAGRSVLYIYPLTGRPGHDLPDGWDAIPGARGCTPEACGFRDHHDELTAAGATHVFGLSSQDTAYQREAADRLGLPFAMLSDTGFRLADALDLPTFEAGGVRLYKRLTLITRDETIEHVFYPIFPPDGHARQVLAWLLDNPA